MNKTTKKYSDYPWNIPDKSWVPMQECHKIPGPREHRDLNMLLAFHASTECPRQPWIRDRRYTWRSPPQAPDTPQVQEYPTPSPPVKKFLDFWGCPPLPPRLDYEGTEWSRLTKDNFQRQIQTQRILPKARQLKEQLQLVATMIGRWVEYSGEGSEAWNGESKRIEEVV